MKDKNGYFPMFVDISEKKIMIVGGGKVASRRAEMLSMFTYSITVVAPEICDKMELLLNKSEIELIDRKWKVEDIDGFDMVVAATDKCDINTLIWKKCREKHIPVNVADDREKCDFFFPAVIMTDDWVIGISTGGKEPAKSAELRRELDEYLKTGGKDD